MVAVPLEIRMTGAVVFPIPAGTSEGDCLALEAWVVGLQHTPFLSLPMDGLIVKNVLPRMHCTYVDSTGIQYAMIDVTGYEIEINDSQVGPQVVLGKMGNLINLAPFLPDDRKAWPQRTGAVAAVLRAWSGRLEQVADCVTRLEAVDQGGTGTFRQQVATQVGLTTEKQAAHTIRLVGHVATHDLLLSVEERQNALTPHGAATDPFRISLSSICGWNGAGDERLDFEDAKAVFPGQEKCFDCDIEYTDQRIHPKTGTCSPKMIL